MEARQGAARLADWIDWSCDIVMRPLHQASCFSYGLLAGLLVFFGLQRAASEPDIGVRKDEPASQSRTIRFPDDGRPMRIVSRLFMGNDDCAAAKVDIWLERGFATYTLFLPGTRRSQRAETVDADEGTTMLIGNDNCRIRVRIDRAPGSDAP